MKWAQSIIQLASQLCGQAAPCWSLQGCPPITIIYTEALATESSRLTWATWNIEKEKERRKKKLVMWFWENQTEATVASGKLSCAGPILAPSSFWASALPNPHPSTLKKLKPDSNIFAFSSVLSVCNHTYISMQLYTYTHTYPPTNMHLHTHTYPQKYALNIHTCIHPCMHTQNGKIKVLSGKGMFI